MTYLNKNIVVSQIKIIIIILRKFLIILRYKVIVFWILLRY